MCGYGLNLGPRWEVRTTQGRSKPGRQRCLGHTGSGWRPGSHDDPLKTVPFFFLLFKDNSLLAFWYIFSQASTMYTEYKLISLLHIILLIIMNYLASIILLRVLREALPRLLGILKIWKCFDFLVHLLLMCSISLILFFFLS